MYTKKQIKGAKVLLSFRYEETQKQYNVRGLLYSFTVQAKNNGEEEVANLGAVIRVCHGKV